MIVARRRVTTLADPVFTWGPSGDLALVTYAGGQTKTFGYDGLQRVSTIDLLSDGVTRRKTLTYDVLSGNLLSVIETTLP